MLYTQILLKMWHTEMKDIAIEQDMPVADCVSYSTVFTNYGI